MPHPPKVSIKKPIVFYSNEYSGHPECVKLEFTPETLHRIATVQCLIIQYKLYSVKIEIPNGFTLMADNEEEDSEDCTENAVWWRHDGETFIIYETGFYFYAQSKYDAADQIESDLITIEEINLLFKPI